MTSELGVLKYGGVSDNSVARASANFSGAAINPLARCLTPIEHLANDGTNTRVGHATGFFWRKGDRVFLVTNWHVVSGRNPFNLALLSPSCYIPERIAFHGQIVKIENNDVRFIREKWIIQFNESMLEVISNPPIINGTVVDILAITIENRTVTTDKDLKIPDGRSLNVSPLVNDHKLEKIRTLSGDDCFVVGYPLENYEGAMYPVWRSGSVASETLVGLGEYPAFLVDATVTPAMSGSPVFRKCNSYVVKYENNAYIEQISHYDMIGVYAGRLKNKDLDRTNLGYAWYKTLIDDVIEHYGFGGAGPVVYVDDTNLIGPP